MDLAGQSYVGSRGPVLATVQVCWAKASVGAVGGTRSCFSESEGDNGDDIEDGEQNGAAKGEMAEGDDAGSVQSTGKVDPQAPGWTRRVRVGNQPLERASCPDRVGALEQTIRGYAEKLGDHVVEPTIGMSFDSLGEAYDFYNLYSWERGFGIRYGKSRLNAEKTKCMQEVVCDAPGNPPRRTAGRAGASAQQ